MKGGKKTNCAETVEKKVESQVKNCFMFDEDESKAGNNVTSSTSLSEKSKLIEFCPDKPYRLALYVHPSTRRRPEMTDSKLLANLTQMRHNQDKENNKKPRKGRTKIEKENIVTLFEENDTSEYQKKTRKLDDPEPAYGQKPNKIARKGILSFLNINESVSKKADNEEGYSSPSKVKQMRPCKAYTKKNKENTISEKIIESPVKEEVNEKEMKKRTKAKVKKDDQKEMNEEEEYEKWAQSINSGFEEIDKFELSITYD